MSTDHVNRSCQQAREDEGTPHISRVPPASFLAFSRAFQRAPKRVQRKQRPRKRAALPLPPSMVFTAGQYAIKTQPAPFSPSSRLETYDSCCIYEDTNVTPCRFSLFFFAERTATNQPPEKNGGDKKRIPKKSRPTNEPCSAAYTPTAHRPFGRNSPSTCGGCERWWGVCHARDKTTKRHKAKGRRRRTPTARHYVPPSSAPPIPPTKPPPSAQRYAFLGVPPALCASILEYEKGSNAAIRLATRPSAAPMLTPPPPPDLSLRSIDRSWMTRVCVCVGRWVSGWMG